LSRAAGLKLKPGFGFLSCSLGSIHENIHNPRTMRCNALGPV
jgi:hypothetical protein